VLRHPDGQVEVMTHSGTKGTGQDPVAVAKQAEAFGAGEILLTSVDRDGTMAGYDIPLVRSVADAVSIPVIGSGGAGSYDDLFQVLTEGHASAAAAASIYHYTEQTPLEGKRHLAERGVRVRL
jgi:cyclase